jgi:peptide/nickel transport system substrate-binding protein
VLLAVAVTSTACAGSHSGTTASGGAGSTQNGGTLTIANDATPVSLDPSISGIDDLAIFVQPAYESLITLQPDGQLTPGLATSWKFLNSTNTQFQLTLRQGVKFSDGTDMTAQAVANSILYFKAGKGAFAHFFSHVTSVKATGTDTVTITLSQPFPDMPYMFDQQGLAGDIIAPAGIKNPGTLATHTLGAGPYVLDPASTIANNTYTYTPNPYYYDKSAIHYNKMVIKVFTDTNSALQALESGQIQLMIGDAQTAKSLTGNSQINVLSSEVYWSGIWLMDYNGQATPAMGNAKVRQALNYAINRAALTKALYGNYATQSSQIRAPGFTGFTGANDGAYPYDPAKAKQLLAEAGYPHGFTLPVTLATTGASLAQALSYQLAQVGVQLKLQVETTTSQLATDLFSGKYSGWVLSYSIESPQLSYMLLIGQIPEFGVPTGSGGAQLASLYHTAISMPQADAGSAWNSVYNYITQQAYFLPVARTGSIYFASKSINVAAPGHLLNVDPVMITPAG